MDFFEKLQRLIINRFESEASSSYGDGYFVGVTATIEALKEMTVGEPVNAYLMHWGEAENLIGDIGRTSVIIPNGLTREGYIGRNGEEVIVMVFRQIKKQGK